MTTSQQLALQRWCWCLSCCYSLLLGRLAGCATNVETPNWGCRVFVCRCGCSSGIAAAEFCGWPPLSAARLLFGLLLACSSLSCLKKAQKSSSAAVFACRTGGGCYCVVGSSDAAMHTRLFIFAVLKHQQQQSVPVDIVTELQAAWRPCTHTFKHLLVWWWCGVLRGCAVM